MQKDIGQPRGRRWKRTIVVALLLLVGGAVVNVAVAWALAVRPEPAVTDTLYQHHRAFTPQSAIEQAPHQTGTGVLIEPPQPRNRSHNVSVEMAGMKLERAFGELRITLSDERARSIVLPRQDLRETGFLGNLPSESVFHDFDDNLASIAVEDTYSQIAERFTGWPMYAFRGVMRLQWQDQSRRLNSQGVIHMPLNKMLNRGDWREDLPVSPLLPGFLINTLFYALLLWLLLAAPFAARRMIRRRRGQCEKCAYPIRTSPLCTECGSPVAGKMAREAKA